MSITLSNNAWLILVCGRRLALKTLYVKLGNLRNPAHFTDIMAKDALAARRIRIFFTLSAKPDIYE